MSLDHVLFFAMVGIAILFAWIAMIKDRVVDSLEPNDNVVITPLVMPSQMGAINAAPLSAYSTVTKEEQK